MGRSKKSADPLIVIIAVIMGIIFYPLYWIYEHVGIESLIFFVLMVIFGIIFHVIYRDKFLSQIKSLEDRADADKLAYDRGVQELKTQLQRLDEMNKRLKQYEGIADADDRAREILNDAKQSLEKANSEAGAILAEARKQANSMKGESRNSLDAAVKHAQQIIEEAVKKAEGIAGSAYEAMKNAEAYENTVKAMKNMIDGYGDRYIIPGYSLLDDLAEEFGHTEAGENLKKARETTKAMIRTGSAATCEYVETNRRETALRFVIDAFNGKVDSALSRVRSDNAGTLKQEILDAFTLVNHHGKAFRDARITEVYLEARIDELKWAAIAQQLRIDEREEQRRIKEQIREEEKARKEFERAMRDAAKEEEMLRKAMDKVKNQVEHASVEQKAKYEQQIFELSQRLKEAEERNQRAMSMAQMTRKGHVYIISNLGSFGEDVYKIGLTRRLEPLDRIRELGDSSVPFEFDVHALIMSDDAPALEKQLHKHFILSQMNKVNYRKEFFRAPLKEIREDVEKLGLAVKWTMLAEAKDYRETLAIEKAIQEDPTARDAWVMRQLQLDPVSSSDEEAEESVSKVMSAAS